MTIVKASLTARPAVLAIIAEALAKLAPLVAADMAVQMVGDGGDYDTDEYGELHEGLVFSGGELSEACVASVLAGLAAGLAEAYEIPGDPYNCMTGESLATLPDLLTPGERVHYDFLMAPLDVVREML